MSTAVVEQKINLPAHLAEFANFAGNELTSGLGAGFPVLSLKGKVWAVVRGGEREIVKNADGDPAASIEVVIVSANPALSKVYYAKGYEEGAAEKPDCYSNDGVAPAADAHEPQAGTCAVCPHNQWGSKIGDNGQKYKACSDSRRIAVAPIGQLNDPMLLRIPAASLRPLSDYGDAFQKKGVPYQVAVTKLGFDPEQASPKVTFKFIGFINAEQAKTVRETMAGDIVKSIVGLDGAPAPAAIAPSTNPAALPAGGAQAPAQPPMPEKKGRAPKAAPAAAPAPAPAAAVPAPAPAPAPAAAAPVETADALEAALNAALGV